jgi:hypothetical protein
LTHDTVERHWNWAISGRAGQASRTPSSRLNVDAVVDRISVVVVM